MDASTSRTSGIGDYFGVLRRRYIWLITILPGAIFICVVAAFAITPQYQATATLMLETSSVPKDVIETTVISYADQQIEIVQGRVMTVASLRRIAQELDPYPGQKTWSLDEKAEQLLRDTSLEKVDPVTLKPQSESNAFSLHYYNPNRALAATIDSKLAQLFITYNQRVRTKAAREAAGFLQQESDGIVQQMREVDAKLADMRHKYGEALPEFQLRNQAIIEDTQRQLDNLQQQILTAQQNESVLSLQLSQLSPNLITQSGDLTDVATVRAKLTEAEQRYTPNHPEVKRLRRALETLMAQSGKSSQGAVQANNPQYLLTQTQLQGARAELANLRAQFNATTGKLERLRAAVSETPTAERAVSELLNRKNVLQTEYQHVQEKLQRANLAKSFESQEGGERFALVRAPSVPKLPAYPNRVGLILLGLVFGAALAGLVVAVAESTDTHLRTVSDLQLPDDVPVLASIPFIKNSEDRRRRAIMVTSFAAAYSAALFVVVAVILNRIR